jgi:hypothetical protein
VQNLTFNAFPVVRIKHTIRAGFNSYGSVVFTYDVVSLPQRLHDWIHTIGKSDTAGKPVCARLAMLSLSGAQILEVFT